MIGASDLTATWDQFADRLLLIARSMGGSAEDAVQEAFIVLARQPEMPDNPLAWLVAVCRNLQRESHRRERRRRARESRVGRQEWFDRDVNLVDSQLDAGAVTEALMRLSSPTREIIVMRVWGEMTFESIADVVELSRATVHREFHDGLKKLKLTFDIEPQPESMRLCHE
ncbi:MAG: sigma-70 family RNA polymerase sigma factor [Planctomycetota bacterium]